jgi:hypothetical protein
LPQRYLVSVVLLDFDARFDYVRGQVVGAGCQLGKCFLEVGYLRCLRVVLSFNFECCILKGVLLVGEGMECSTAVAVV